MPIHPKTLTADELTAIAEAVEGSPRDDYSGRGMFGERCVAIDVDGAKEFALGVAACDVLGADRAMSLGRATRTDSMGLGTVVYWPGWKLAEGETLESGDHDLDRDAPR